MVKVIMHGCNGKMGRVVCARIHADKELEIVAGVDVTLPAATFPVFSSINQCDMAADVIVDFSTALAVPDLLEYALKKKTPLVLCTTGIGEDMYERLEEISREIPVFFSANMSIGINLLSLLVRKAAVILSASGFDIEVIESHHNQKIDAPSGTSYLIANEINEALGGEYKFVTDRARSKEKRGDKEIGIHSIRGGTIVGDHSVLFAGADEILEITHKAGSKDIYAKGAVEAARFLVGKPAGRYNMNDLLGKV